MVKRLLIPMLTIYVLCWGGVQAYADPLVTSMQDPVIPVLDTEKAFTVLLVGTSVPNWQVRSNNIKITFNASEMPVLTCTVVYQHAPNVGEMRTSGLSMDPRLLSLTDRAAWDGSRDWSKPVIR